MYERIGVVAVIATVLLVQPLRAQQTCESLRGLTLPHTEITSAALVPEEALKTAPGAPAGLVAPAHCAVEGIARPTSDSEIRFELWLPTTGWNGKYVQVGNGGWAGAVIRPALVEPLRRGYAVAGTDDGHGGGMMAGARWAIGHPEKLVDFGYRAVHETSEQARAITAAFYGKAAGRAYFIGCSDGGREALMEAQRYPEDFDGIIAGAPANAWSHLTAALAPNQQAQLVHPIPVIKLPAIQRAALAACDGLDGVQDGLIEDPRACRFDPAVLACRGADGPDCLTTGQLATLRQIYQGSRDPVTGAALYPGFPPGTEAVPGGWAPWIIGDPPERSIETFFANAYFAQAVYEDTTWSLRRFDLARDLPVADRKVGAVLDATNPDLRSFRAHGGKLIQYHGWGDAAIPALGSIEYYESVRAFLDRFPDPRTKQRGPIQDFYRLFMVPGMGHCDGGIGPKDLGQGALVTSRDPERNVISALEQWVEHGVAPEKIIAAGTVVGDSAKHLTRPLCPYPRVARYNGSGDVNDAASFTCAEPK